MITRDVKLDIPGFGTFNLVTKSDITPYRKWFDSVIDNLDTIVSIGREQLILEEEMFLQAATECEKDFYYLKDNIDIEEEIDGKNQREYVILPSFGHFEYEDYF
jgi:hypothetical protein